MAASGFLSNISDCVSDNFLSNMSTFGALSFEQTICEWLNACLKLAIAQFTGVRSHRLVQWISVASSTPLLPHIRPDRLYPIQFRAWLVKALGFAIFDQAHSFAHIGGAELRELPPTAEVWKESGAAALCCQTATSKRKVKGNPL